MEEDETATAAEQNKSSQSAKTVTRQAQPCPRSRMSPERSRKYVRSGMTPRANDLSLNPLQRGSSNQKLAPGRRGVARAGARGGINYAKQATTSRQKSSETLKNATAAPKPICHLPEPLTISSRRWLSAELLDQVNSETSSTFPAMDSHGGASNENNGVNTMNSDDKYGQEELENESSQDKMSRCRTNSEPMPYGMGVSAKSKLRSQSAINNDSSKGVDSVEIAQQLVQSSDEVFSNDNDSSTTDVFHPSNEALPMSLLGHPFVFPMEDVPPPLTITSVEQQVVPCESKSPRKSPVNVNTLPHENQIGDSYKVNEEAATAITNTTTPQSPTSQQSLSEVKSAWHDGEPVSPTALSLSPRRKERRHSGNIDFRAATSSSNKKPHPLPKSKSSWRLQAAKARESVANLLSFATSRGKDKNDGLKGRKSSGQYLSSPCLSAASTPPVSPTGRDFASFFTSTAGLSKNTAPGIAGQVARSVAMHWSNPEMGVHNGMRSPSVVSTDSETVPASETYSSAANTPTTTCSFFPNDNDKCVAFYREDENDLDIPEHSETSVNSGMNSKPCQDSDEEVFTSVVSNGDSKLLVDGSLTPIYKQTEHCKSTPDLLSDSGQEYLGDRLQQERELSKSQDNLQMCLPKSNSTDTTSAMEDTSIHSSPSLLTSRDSQNPVLNKGSSDGQEMQVYKACPWLSPNLQRTLSAVRKHLSARGFPADATQRQVNDSPSSLDSVDNKLEGENHPSSTIDDKESNDQTKAVESRTDKTNTDEQRTPAVNDDYKQYTETEADTHIAKTTESKHSNMSNHRILQLLLQKQLSDSAVDYTGSSVSLTDPLSPANVANHSEIQRSYGIPTKAKIHRRPLSAEIQSPIPSAESPRRSRPLLTSAGKNLFSMYKETDDSDKANVKEQSNSFEKSSLAEMHEKDDTSFSESDTVSPTTVTVPDVTSIDGHDESPIPESGKDEEKEQTKQQDQSGPQKKSPNIPETDPQRARTHWDYLADNDPYRHARNMERSDSLTSLNSEISILSTRSEARGKRETSRRVEDLLSNQLFKKHLARHADTIERKLFRMHKRGIRKALSNFDLSTSQTAFVGGMVHNFLNSGDINNNEDNSDDDDTKWNDDDCFKPTVSRSMSLCERHLFTSSVTDVSQNDQGKSDNSIRHHRPFKKAATTMYLQRPANSDSSHYDLPCDESEEETRRNSLSCDDLSLYKLKETLSNQRRKRLHIPSFKEFRKQRSTSELNPDAANTRLRFASDNASQGSDIYVIQEDEGDSTTSSTSHSPCDENFKTNTPEPGSKNYHSEYNSSRESGSKGPKHKDKEKLRKGHSTSPVFMHPDIIITAADVPKARHRTPNRLLLNRSKSESNMKARRGFPPPRKPLDAKNSSTLAVSAQPHSLSTESLHVITNNDDENSDIALGKPRGNTWPLETIENPAIGERNDAISFERPHSKFQHHLPDDRKEPPNDNLQILSEKPLSSTSYNHSDNCFPSSDDENDDESNDEEMGEDQTYSNNMSDDGDDEEELEGVMESDDNAAGESTPTIFTNAQFDAVNSKAEKYEYNSPVSNLADPSLSNSTTSDEEGGASTPQNEQENSENELKGKNVFLESLGFNFDASPNASGQFLATSDSRSVHFDQSFDSRKSSYDSSHDNNEKLDTGNAIAQVATGHFRPSDDRSGYSDIPKNDARLFELSGSTANVVDDVTSQNGDVNSIDLITQRKSPTSSSSDSDQSNKTAVLRSTSDVSAVASDERERRRRDRKDRPYKSDPFTGTNKLPQHSLHSDTGLYKSPSVSTSCSFPSLEELAEYSDSTSYQEGEDEESRKRRNRLSNISTASEDSGVVGHIGGDGEGATGARNRQSCAHCTSYSTEGPHFGTRGSVPHSLSDGILDAVAACKKCAMRARERKETIQEIAETEKRYGKDLQILKEEFYRPMKATSLLTLDQLDTIFINLEELIHVHKQFMSKFTSALIDAVKAGDEELATVNVGSIFNESSTMFLAFENYCVNQAQANSLLEQLEKEKELLRVFLEVAQNQNPKLRRMHLKSFLMMPVQRVMKYPLLLSRLYKVTPSYHVDKDEIKQAQENIEDILQHINAKTKIPARMKRRSLEFHGYSLSDKIEVNRVAIEVLGWNKKDVCDIMTSRLWFGQVPDPSWASKRARNVKFNMIHAVLLTHGRPIDSPSSHLPLSPRESPPVMQVAFVLVKEKGGRFQLARDPFLMDRCVVTVDPEYNHVFELHEQGKETYLFKAEHSRETAMWIRHLKQLSRNLGYWRRRRNGLPNIMLKPHEMGNIGLR